MIYYLAGLLISTFFIGIPLVKTLLKMEGNTNDLLFLVFCNFIFLFATTAFYFTFEELLLAFFAAFFLFAYSFLLLVQLQKINQKTSLLEYPYLFFCFSVFFLFFWFLFF